jgi:hypothetical protein
MSTSPTLFGSDALLDRLAGGGRPVVFLVGSALTMPIRGGPGVAGIDGVIEIVRGHLGKPKGSDWQAKAAAKQAVKSLDDALAAAPDGGARYQIAFAQLKARGDGADSLNAVIREAVLRARTSATPVALDDVAALAALERSAEGWHLGPAVKALGLLVARHPRFRKAVLTTNFDPLVEVAIRAAGGQAQAIELIGDGALPSSDPAITSVIHLHGLWRSDTLHTPGALTVERAALERALARLYEDVTLVVIAYGGWDDVLMQALAKLTIDASSKPDVLWCFFERDIETIKQRYPKVLTTLGHLRERAVCYGGIDCNAVLPRLRERLDHEGELLGRGSLCSELLDALDRGNAIEIVGEPQMGRSHVLRWAAKQAALFDKRAARVSAKELARPTPEALLRKVAEVLGCLEVVEAALYEQRALPNEADAARALRLLHGSWIVIDDAEALAVEGNGFSGGTFFAELRGAVQDRKIHWISASSQPLGDLFEARGLTSRFLNDAVRTYAGGLDRTEVRLALGARLGAKADAAIALSGTLHRLVERVCKAEWGDVDETLRGLSEWAEDLCSLWWERSPEEQRLLVAIAQGKQLSGRERADAVELCKRGLVIEVGDGFALNGGVWEAYVRRRA